MAGKAPVPRNAIDVLDSFCTPEKRIEICRCFWGVADDDLIKIAENILSEKLKVRPVFFRKLPLEKRAECLSVRYRMEMLIPQLESALREYHFKHHRKMMAAFLDACGVPNKEGAIDDAPELDPAVAVKAAVKIKPDFSPDDMRLYFASVIVLIPEWSEAALSALNTVRANYGDDKTTAKTAIAPIQKIPAGDTDEFTGWTTLDQVMILQAVATASNESGALSHEKMRDLVDEVVALKSSRMHSYFHCGFVNTLLGQEPDYFGSPELNAERRSWLLAGQTLATERRFGNAGIVNIYDNKCLKDVLKEAVGLKGAFAPGPALKIAPHVFNALWAAERFSDAISVISPLLLSYYSPGELFHVQECASELLRKRRNAEAFELLKLLLETNRKGKFYSSDWSQSLRRQFDFKVRRRWFQCERVSGHWDISVEGFGKLVGDYPDLLTSNLYVDIGLAAGKLHWLSEVEILGKGSKHSLQTVKNSIEAGMQWFEKALSIDDDDKINVNYVFGVHHLIRGEYPKACEFLEKAHAGASVKKGNYAFDHLLDKMSLYYSLSVFYTLQEAKFPVACEIIREVSEKWDPASWPFSLVRGALDIAIPEPEGECLWNFAKRNFPEIIKAMIAADTFLDRLPNLLLPELKAKADLRTRPPRERFSDYQRLLSKYMSLQRNEEAAEVLDRMEQLVIENPKISEQYLKLLENQDNYTPAWEYYEGRNSRCNILESTGNLEQVASEMVDIFYYHRQKQENEEATGIIDRIKKLGLGEKYYGKLEESMLEELGEAAEEVHVRKEMAVPVSLIFLGGNEKQKRYDDEILKYLLENHPNIKVTFIHSGWSSNWTDYFETVKKQLAAHDGLIILSLVRTQLGRKVRKLAGELQRPWFPCTGRGKEFCIRAILNAVNVISFQKQ